MFAEDAPLTIVGAAQHAKKRRWLRGCANRARQAPCSKDTPTAHTAAGPMHLRP